MKTTDLSHKAENVVDLSAIDIVGLVESNKNGNNLSSIFITVVVFINFDIGYLREGIVCQASEQYLILNFVVRLLYV